MATLIWIWAKLSLVFLPQDSKMARSLRCHHDLHTIRDSDKLFEGFERTDFYLYRCRRCGRSFEL